MKNLRRIRIAMSVLMLIAAVGLLVFNSTLLPCRYVEKLQLIPLLLGETVGITLFWVMVTVLFGRIYCSFVCPVGALQDVVAGIRRRIPRLRRAGFYREPMKVRYHVLIIYFVCLLLSFAAVPLLIEPWSIMRNIAQTVNPGPMQAMWIRFGLNAATGVVAGIASLVMLLVWSWFSGRDFCNVVCPIGTALGMLVDRNVIYHIEIDPDRCTSCMKCEEECKSGCIKVVSRYVDNSRCVRCFDCVANCPEKAIRYQINRNRPATPLMRRAKKAGS